MNLSRSNVVEVADEVQTDRPWSHPKADRTATERIDAEISSGFPIDCLRDHLRYK